MPLGVLYATNAHICSDGRMAREHKPFPRLRRELRSRRPKLGDSTSRSLAAQEASAHQCPSTPFHCDCRKVNRQREQLAVSGATANNSTVPCYLVDFITEVDGFDRYVQTNKSIAWTSKNSIFTVSIGSVFGPSSSISTLANDETSSPANDVDLSFRVNTTDQPAGTQLHKITLDSYFSTVERLYRAGARAFVFNGIMPFDRAQHGIVLGPELQATLKAHIIDYSRQLEGRVKTFCASKRDLSVCFYYDVCAYICPFLSTPTLIMGTLVSLGNELMDHYQKYGFLTPDGVCPSYGGPSCTADPVGDPTCLGPASKCTFYHAWGQHGTVF